MTCLLFFPCGDDASRDRWSRQREWLEKLNLQAVINVTRQTDEFVKELLISHAKVRANCSLGIVEHRECPRLPSDPVNEVLLSAHCSGSCGDPRAACG